MCVGSGARLVDSVILRTCFCDYVCTRLSRSCPHSALASQHEWYVDNEYGWRKCVWGKVLSLVRQWGQPGDGSGPGKPITLPSHHICNSFYCIRYPLYVLLLFSFFKHINEWKCSRWEVLVIREVWMFAWMVIMKDRRLAAPVPASTCSSTTHDAAPAECFPTYCYYYLSGNLIITVMDSLVHQFCLITCSSLTSLHRPLFPRHLYSYNHCSLSTAVSIPSLKKYNQGSPRTSFLSCSSSLVLKSGL